MFQGILMPQVCNNGLACYSLFFANHCITDNLSKEVNTFTLNNSSADDRGAACAKPILYHITLINLIDYNDLFLPFCSLKKLFVPFRKGFTAVNNQQDQLRLIN